MVLTVKPQEKVCDDGFLSYEMFALQMSQCTGVAQLKISKLVNVTSIKWHTYFKSIIEYKAKLATAQRRHLSTCKRRGVEMSLRILFNECFASPSSPPTMVGELKRSRNRRSLFFSCSSEQIIAAPPSTIQAIKEIATLLFISIFDMSQNRQ